MTSKGHAQARRSVRRFDLEVALRHDLRTFTRLARRTAHHPTPEHVHDLRVVIRRIRAEFSLVPPPCRGPSIRRSRRDLNRLASVLGEQRKYDVALNDAEQYGRPTGSIRRRLKAARRRVGRALRGRKRHRYARHVIQAATDTRAVDARLFGSRIALLQRRLDAARRHPPVTAAARHRLRLHIKKARYLIEAGRGHTAGLQRVQDRLGRWHDLMVLAAEAGADRQVAHACRREWQRVERCLGPALRDAIRQLSTLAAMTQA